MTRNDASSRFSSMTGSSTDSARSSITVKPLPSIPVSASASSNGGGSLSGLVNNASRSVSHGSRRAAPSRLKTDDNGQLARAFKESDGQVSPTSTSESRLALSPSSVASNASIREHRMSDLADYRRDLAILDPIGGRSSRNQQNNPSTGSLNQVTTWMAAPTPVSTGPIPTSFYDDSTDNLSVISSQMSPGIRAGTARPSQTTAGSTDSPDNAYFTDERRPSIASITTTASSQGSRASGTRGGFRKLQGFFGEEFPGRDSSEISLTHPTGKEHRSHSYSHGRPHRDRNYSNATDHGRDASPSSRPRTPVPAPEVVPFLYQEADDIARYGEAPVRDILSGPDRERYVNESSQQNVPPKTSSSGRSGHSIVHLSGHHRHNKSNEDPRSLRPSISREDSTVSIPKDRSGSAAMFSSRSRAQSPVPSSNGSYRPSKNGSADGQTSPGQQKKSLFGRFGRKHRDRDDTSDLKKLPPSSQSLQSRPSKPEFFRQDGHLPRGAGWGNGAGDGLSGRPDLSRHATGPQTFNKFNNAFSLSKKPRTVKQPDDLDDAIGPLDTHDGGTMFHLDTNLNDMDGILRGPMPLTPMDASEIMQEAAPELMLQTQTRNENGAWNAPISWAVRRETDEHAAQTAELDDLGSPPRPEEKLNNYCIRVFRPDGTFATLQMPLLTNAQELVGQIVKKSYLQADPAHFKLIMKKHDIHRVLRDSERPLLIQKRLLEQVGYVERDKIEDLGREDNSYLCRFLFYAESDKSYEITSQPDSFRATKPIHVDLSGRSLTTIPVYLYPKAPDIIALNLSKNLSLVVPGDFIRACEQLRDIKFNNNEARALPSSLTQALKLTYLDVSNNRLEDLEKAELHRLKGLLKLNLANNKLRSLPRSFGDFTQLRTLNISSNSLEQFPSFLSGMDNLVDLDLSFNSIRTFPDNIGNMTNLERFVITNNKLTGSFPPSFKELRSLRELDIKYNMIQNIDVISQLPKLEILSATRNEISQFSGTFERIRSLKLNMNPIAKFEIKSPVPTLKALNLSHAQLASIDESFNNMPSLERLELDRNYFVSLPAQLGNLTRLEYFSIANNSVGELPVEIGCLHDLRRLDIRNNNIRKLPNEIWWANKLDYLNASSNVLDNFPKLSSRAPQPPGEANNSSTSLNGRIGPPPGGLSRVPSAEELNGDSRRPSQASSSLLSVGPSPVPAGSDRKPSMVSVYGKGGRKTSVLSRTTTSSNLTLSSPATSSRKDSSALAQRLTNTFAGSLRYLSLADNQLDDECFEQLVMLENLRVLNLSYNDLSDMPQRSIKCWPQLLELYLSGNELSSLPADDLEDYSMLQTLHINGNKFTNLPADISRAKKLTVFDCGSNSLKYNIANVPYDWNWNLNPALRYLNLSGNRRLEIKQSSITAASQNREQYTDFSRLVNLRVLGLMDVTVLGCTLPDQNEDRRVRTSGSLAGYMPYGMADTLGSKSEHLSTIDLVVPRFNSNDSETLLGLFDGQTLSSGGSKIAKYLQENFGHIFTNELKALSTSETPEDALRRSFLALNKDLIAAGSHTDDRSLMSHRGSTAPLVLSREDLNSGGVATIVYIQNQDLFVANVGDVQAMMIHTDTKYTMLTKKHDPADIHERARIREAGGWVSRNGRLNDLLEVSRAFGYMDMLPAVQSAPHIHRHAIGEGDETILIATKEVWELMSPQLLVDITRPVRNDPMRAAQKVRDLAMAYGCTNKIMVMMLSVAKLKERRERSRLHRGQSMSVFASLQDENHFGMRKTKKTKDGPLDSTLQRLTAEVNAPTGTIAIVFTDIKNSTQLWETFPESMRSAIKQHNELMRRQLRNIGGFEVKTEGDAFMVSFPTATSALLWCFAVQSALLEVDWPGELMNSVNCAEVRDRDDNVIFRGLSVRMGIHWGEPLAEPDPVTRRMDYYGPMVNKASRISACADGGQIAVSSDFIAEIQRCLEAYQEVPENEEQELEFGPAIRNELRKLSGEGFEVKDMGEKKLKGLENPELIYSLYPHSLSGRIETHTKHESEQTVKEKNGRSGPAILTPGSSLSIYPQDIFELCQTTLRLEMLCSMFEESSLAIKEPELGLLERMRERGGEVTEEFLLNFMEHQVSRIESSVASLTIRHLAMKNSSSFNPRANQVLSRGPIMDILTVVADQLQQAAKYKEKYREPEPEEPR